ncbi:Pseudouridine synthase I, TruA like protein, partial [Aduncisulcus paluster]
MERKESAQQLVSKDINEGEYPPSSDAVISSKTSVKRRNPDEKSVIHKRSSKKGTAFTAPPPIETIYGKTRVVAMCLSYLGSRYSGLQLNPDVVTIEHKLLEAFNAAKIFPRHDGTQDTLKGIKYSRAGRTDKGVHAERLTISFKARLKENMIADVNAALPEDIRLQGVIPVTNSFDSKGRCDRRIYEYMLPLYALLPVSNYDDSQRKFKEVVYGCAKDDSQGLDSEIIASCVSPYDFLDIPLPESVEDRDAKLLKEFENEKKLFTSSQHSPLKPEHTIDHRKQETSTKGSEDSKADNEESSSHLEQSKMSGDQVPPLFSHEERYQFRGKRHPLTCPDTRSSAPTPPDRPSITSLSVNPTDIGRLDALLSLYEGSHRYHNFTVRIKPTQAQAMRYILRCGVEDVLCPQCEAEWNRVEREKKMKRDQEKKEEERKKEEEEEEEEEEEKKEHQQEDGEVEGEKEREKEEVKEVSQRVLCRSILPVWIRRRHVSEEASLIASKKKRRRDSDNVDESIQKERMCASRIDSL